MAIRAGLNWFAVNEKALNVSEGTEFSEELPSFIRAGLNWFALNEMELNSSTGVFTGDALPFIMVIRPHDSTMVVFPLNTDFLHTMKVNRQYKTMAVPPYRDMVVRQ